MPKSGLLQSGLITLYMMYLTWSSMANNPDGHCNPLYPINNSTTDVTTVKPTTDGTTAKPDTPSQQHMDTTSIIGLVIWFLCLLYSSIRTASSSQAASKHTFLFRNSFGTPYLNQDGLNFGIFVNDIITL